LCTVAQHQANHARIQALRTEAEALSEQLKTSVSALASLRHELFETPATTFPADTRPVPFDELLQYAKTISQHTVPPTYRERAPQVAADKDKDKDKDDAVSSGVLTNGVNTPANLPNPLDVTKDATAEAKDGESAENAPAEVTAEEEEWLKKLHDSKIAWYPWPSDDKIRNGNLYKLMAWQARGKDTDKFDIHAYEEAERIKFMAAGGVAVAQPEEEQVQQPQVQQQPPGPRPVAVARPPKKTFDDFDDLDDD
jgi:hypothetical protein